MKDRMTQWSQKGRRNNEGMTRSQTGGQRTVQSALAAANSIRVLPTPSRIRPRNSIAPTGNPDRCTDCPPSLRLSSYGFVNRAFLSPFLIPPDIWLRLGHSPFYILSGTLVPPSTRINETFDDEILPSPRVHRIQLPVLAGGDHKLRMSGL